MEEKESLEERVKKFERMEIPGQPIAMHMGTLYLMKDLWQEVQRLRQKVEEMEDKDA